MPQRPTRVIARTFASFSDPSPRPSGRAYALPRISPVDADRLSATLQMHVGEKSTVVLPWVNGEERGSGREGGELWVRRVARSTPLALTALLPSRPLHSRKYTSAHTPRQSWLGLGGAPVQPSLGSHLQMNSFTSAHPRIYTMVGPQDGQGHVCDAGIG